MADVRGILISLGFGSHGQRLLLAVRVSLPTTHDYRKLRGDPGFQYRDVNAGQRLV